MIDRAEFIRRCERDIRRCATEAARETSAGLVLNALVWQVKVPSLRGVMGLSKDAQHDAQYEHLEVRRNQIMTTLPSMHTLRRFLAGGFVVEPLASTEATEEFLEAQQWSYEAIKENVDRACKKVGLNPGSPNTAVLRDRLVQELKEKAGQFFDRQMFAGVDLAEDRTSDRSLATMFAMNSIYGKHATSAPHAIARMNNAPNQGKSSMMLRWAVERASEGEVINIVGPGGKSLLLGPADMLTRKASEPRKERSSTPLRAMHDRDVERIKAWHGGGLTTRNGEVHHLPILDALSDVRERYVADGKRLRYDVYETIGTGEVHPRARGKLRNDRLLLVESAEDRGEIIPLRSTYITAQEFRGWARHFLRDYNPRYGVADPHDPMLERLFHRDRSHAIHPTRAQIADELERCAGVAERAHRQIKTDDDAFTMWCMKKRTPTFPSSPTPDPETAPNPDARLRFLGKFR